VSQTATREIECSCGARVQVFVADSINAERHPHMRQAVLDRNLHVFKCSACDIGIVVENRFWYLDLDRGQFYGVWPNRDRAGDRACGETVVNAFELALGERAGATARTLFDATTFHVRLCFGNEELREKIIACEAGLSDLALEALKVRILAETRELGEVDLVKLGVQTMRLDHVEDNGDLAFYFEQATAPTRVLEIGMVVPRKSYDDFAAIPWQDLLATYQGIASGPHVSLLRLLRT
jgi:hypothetical protein